MGRPKKDSKEIMDFIRQNQDLASRKIVKKLKERGITLSFNTVLKRMKEMNMPIKNKADTSVMGVLRLFNDDLTVGELKDILRKLGVK